MTTTPPITRSIERYENHDDLADVWFVDVDGVRVSHLFVDTTTGEILNVWTADTHQGRGYATALYRQATTERHVVHAPETHRTDDGSRFRARVGGPELPPCTTCCAHLYDTDDDYDNEGY